MASDYSAITEHNERQLGLDTKSRRTQISMYSDPTHFVFEILQNADDYGATEVDFKLTQDALTIEHNGIAFEQQNVRAITYFGFSTSDSDRMKTGRFGVGFKAVFAFTATPLVYSGAEHFKIFGLYRICSVPYPEKYNSERTRFVLPFNLESEKPDFVTEFVSPSDAYGRLAKRLQTLDIKALLFTKNIREIRWATVTNEGHYLREDIAAPENLSRMTTITDGKNVHEYLVYATTVEWAGERHKNIEIAFALEKHTLKPIKEPLYVLFSTKQQSGYHFIINAPFNTTPNRERILDDDALNTALIDMATGMFSDILADLRKRGLITRDSLAVFPNKQDSTDESLSSIRSKIVDLFNRLPFVPTQAGGFAPANVLVQGHGELKALLDSNDLLSFFRGKASQWAINCLQNTRSALFLDTLCIEKWDWREFVAVLCTHFGQKVDTLFDNWLSEQPDEWMGRLYAALWQNVCEEYWYKYFDKNALGAVRIVRLQKGNHVAGSEAYFPADICHSESLEIPMVKEQVLQVGNDKLQNRIWSFLKNVGVSDYDAIADIQIILSEWYAKDTPCPSAEQHLAHMRQFIPLVRNSPDSLCMFNGMFIFLDNRDTFSQAHDFILDIPFEQTHLASLLDHSVPGYAEYRQLYLGYESLVDDGFVEFAKKAGVHSVIPITKCKVYDNPDSATLLQNLIKYNTRESDYTINQDFCIRSIDTICECKHVDVAKCLWRTMCKAKPDELVAKYRPNQKYAACTAPSQLIHYLRCAEWIPCKDGKFYKPCDLSKDDLVEGFTCDDSNGWLQAVQFGKNRIITPESEMAILRKYHISEELIREREGLSESEIQELDRRQLKAAREIKANRTNTSDRGLDTGVTDPERRAKKEAERISDAIDSEPPAETRTRTVARKEWELRDPKVKRQLFENYNGRCQVCGDEGFETKSGEIYFVVNYHRKLPDAKWLDHWGNALCVCPRCHSKIEYGHTDIADIDETVLALRLIKEGGDSPLDVKFSLCGAPATIHFKERHLIAWREVLKHVKRIDCHQTGDNNHAVKCAVDTNKPDAPVEAAEPDQQPARQPTIIRDACPHCGVRLNPKNYTDHVVNKCPKRHLSDGAKTLARLPSSGRPHHSPVREWRTPVIASNKCSCGRIAMPGSDSCYTCSS